MGMTPERRFCRSRQRDDVEHSSFTKRQGFRSASGTYFDSRSDVKVWGSGDRLRLLVVAIAADPRA
jgi:hypothetical protein